MRKLLILAVVVFALAAPSLASACNDTKYKVAEARAIQKINSASDREFYDEYDELDEYEASAAKGDAFRAKQILLTSSYPCSARLKKERTLMLSLTTSLYKAYNATLIGQLQLSIDHLDDAIAYMKLLKRMGVQFNL